MPCSSRRPLRPFAFIALLAAAALAGCDTSPGPFAHAPGRPPAATAIVPDAGGVVIRPIAGPPENVADALQKAMVDALALQDIPAATSGGNRRSRYLQGLVSARPHGAGNLRLQVAWALTDPAGRSAGSKTITKDVPLVAWQRADSATLKALAGVSATAVAAMIQGPAPADVGTAHHVPLHVYPVAGVPDVDAIALRRAMEKALRDRDYEVRPELGDNALVIAGNVALGKPDRGQVPIEISWAVLDSTGKELGRLAQNNTLSVGDGPPNLAAIAEDIAEAAAGGVVEVLDSLPPPGGTPAAGNKQKGK